MFADNLDRGVLKDGNLYELFFYIHFFKVHLIQNYLLHPTTKLIKKATNIFKLYINLSGRGYILPLFLFVIKISL